MLAHRVIRVRLHVDVERRDDAKTTVEEESLALAPEHLVLRDDPGHVVAEERREIGCGTRELRARGVQRRFQRRVLVRRVFSEREVLLLEHALQHNIPTLFGLFREAQGVPAARVLRDSGDGRGLDRVELLGRHTKVQLGGGLNAVHARSVLRDVEVLLEHLFLAAINAGVFSGALGAVLLVQLVFVGHGHAPLADLAGQRRLGRLVDGLLPFGLIFDVLSGLDQRVLHQLLRDRRRATGRVRTEVVLGGGEQALTVDAVVQPETLVLNVNLRLLHPRRDLLKRNHFTVLVVEGREQGGAVARINARRLRQGGLVELFGERLKEFGSSVHRLASNRDGW